MITLHGKGVYGGIAIGRLSFLRRRGVSVRRRTVSDISAELARFEIARERALSELDEKFRTVKGGKGIAYTVPMTSTIGVAIYQFLSNTTSGGLI